MQKTDFDVKGKEEEQEEKSENLGERKVVRKAGNPVKGGCDRDRDRQIKKGSVGCRCYRGNLTMELV